MIARFFKIVSICVAGTLSTLSLPLHAYAPADNDGREKASQRVAETAMADFAKCVVGVKKREAKAMEFLRLPDGDPKQSPDSSAIAVSGCAAPGSQMRFQSDLFSRSIYTALYRKYYLRTPPVAVAVADPADYQSEFDITRTPVGTMQLALRAFGDCTVQQNPAAAHDFAISEIRGQSEKAIVPAVVTSMQQCLSTGSTLKFSRTMLKGIIAESLYKMRRRQAAPAAAGATQ